MIRQSRGLPRAFYLCHNLADTMIEDLETGNHTKLQKARCLGSEIALCIIARSVLEELCSLLMMMPPMAQLFSTRAQVSRVLLSLTITPLILGF